MEEVYQIFFLDGTEIKVKSPDIDEENRIVKVESKGELDETRYDYYPFEFIKKIIYLCDE